MFACSTDVTSISHQVIHSRFWHIRHCTTVACCYILRFVYRCNHSIRIVQTYATCIAWPAEPVQPLRPWWDQKSCHLWSKPCIFRVLVRPIIVRLRFFTNSRTNLLLLPPPLYCYSITAPIA